MRQFRLLIEAESTITIDETKLTDYFGEGTSVLHMEKAVEQEIRDGELNRDGVAMTFGTADGYDKYSDTRVICMMEEHCETHDHWYPIAAKSPGNCYLCVNEERDAKAAAAEAKRQKRAARQA